MAASYPTSVKSFTTKVDGVDDVQADHVNDLQLEVAAVETELLTVGTWVVAVTGFSADPANMIGRYVKRGKICTIWVRMPTNGTSNATTFTVSLPFTAATITNMSWVGFAVVIDNGTQKATPGLVSISSGGTTATLVVDLAGTAWTSSGGKRATFTIEYETA